MIYGIGVDIVAVVRMEKTLERHNNKLPEKLLTAEEFTEFLKHPHPAIFLAKRFAVKEAVAKAFGTGFRNGLQHHHIGLTHTELGCPQLVFYETAKDWIKEQEIINAHVSLSDEKDTVIAYVILEANANKAASGSA